MEDLRPLEGGAAADGRVRAAVGEDAPAVVALYVACAMAGGLGWELVEARFGATAATAWAIACAALALVGRGAVAALLVARERRAIAALPFETRGYFEALGAPPTATSTAVVIVKLGRAPTAEEEARIEGSARASGAEVAASRGDEIELRRHDVASVGRRGPTNGALRRVQRDLIDRVIVPLHGVVPVRSVTFRR